MKTNFSALVCGVVVAVLLITSLAVPVIANGNYTRTEYTVLSNEGIPLIKGNVDDEYTVQWDSALPSIVKVNGDVTTVYFVAGDDATVSPESKEVTVDLTYGDLPVPTRTGYTFDGWFTSTQYTTEVTEDTVVEGKSDKILYAKWVGNEYTITFDAGDGTVSPATKTVTYGQAYGELPVPTYTGHIFGGWFNEDDEVITAQNIVDVADDQTLTAVWTLEQYTVSFTTDGHGTVDVNSITVDYGTAYTISSNTITIGSTTITATATSPYVFDHWSPSTSGTVEGTMTFMAYFNDPPVTITFNTDGVGTVDTQSIANVPRGTQYVVADNVVTITGYSPVTASLPNGYYMVGWNIAQGTGTITDAMTFTAQYEVIEIAEVFCSSKNTWIITNDGKLFGCGDNQYGQQGDGTTVNVTTFTERLENETISTVSCSKNTTWVLTTDGKLFGCGRNTNGQQGDGTTTDVKTFTQRLSGETIASISSNDFGTWAVTTDGKLFGCGSGYGGAQGNGSTSNVTSFTQRLSGETIANVYSGTGDRTWAVTTDGKLFGCGSGAGGAQGNGSTTNVTSFTQRLDNETVASVTCSGNNTWAVTTDGKLFGCGQNSYGQQGDGTTNNVTTFTQRLDNETVANVYSGGGYATWVVTTDGKLFGCGSGNGGAQGDGTSTNVTTFTQRLSGETIASVSTNIDISNSSGTTWAVTTDGKLFGCGSNTDGQQGDGTTTNVTTFTQRLSGQTIASVSSSIITIWAVTTDGKLFGCGDNDQGQQGDGTTTDVKTFTQRGPAGSVNIPVIVPLNPHIITPIGPSIIINPVVPVMTLVTPNDIVGTDYTFHAGGNDWMLCTVSVGQDQYALALYIGLTEPLLWDQDVTMVFSNGSMTIENNGQSYTLTYTSIYFKGNGNYVLTSESAYVWDDTEIIGFAIPTSDSAIEVYGTVSDYGAITLADGTITLGDADIESALTDYDDVYLVSEVSATYDTDQTAICSSVIVPKNVTITETVEDTSLAQLMYAVPLFLVIGVLMFVVGFVVYRRM